MDYVYICRSGDNEELRYSLRSIDKNIPNANVWIVGDAPNWFSGNLIPNNSRGVKYAKARSNLGMITDTSEIANEFVLMNDDFYIMKEMDTPPIWHEGLLLDVVKDRNIKWPRAPYNDMLEDTYHRLHRMSVESVLSYELHTPLIMTKTGLRQALKHGGLWRSMYGNMNNIGGEYHKDIKIYPASNPLSKDNINIDSSIFLSSMDESFKHLKENLLDRRFPFKSKYEAD